jgi:hypothetical protein
MRRVVTLFANYYLQTGLLLLYYYVNERIFVDEKSSYIICKLLFANWVIAVILLCKRILIQQDCFVLLFLSLVRALGCIHLIKNKKIDNHPSMT